MDRLLVVANVARLALPPGKALADPIHTDTILRAVFGAVLPLAPGSVPPLLAHAEAVEAAAVARAVRHATALAAINALVPRVADTLGGARLALSVLGTVVRADGDGTILRRPPNLALADAAVA